MGRPMPGWDVQILDEDEQPLPAGERGEICLRARSNPHYPLGYWNRPEDSEETFGGDWFHTKDAAEQDADGYYWYAGRADDVIISAGYRIGPFEVESACIEHPSVREAAAVASPDERRGSVVKAFVVLAEGHAPSDELADEIKRFVRDRHSAYAYPRRIEFVDDLPKTLTGKIRRVELRERGAHRRVKAVQIVDLSGPDTALRVQDLPEPEPSHMLSPGSGVVVDVHAAGVSFPEVLQTRGEYQLKPPLPFVPGSEVAGIVRSAPERRGREGGRPRGRVLRARRLRRGRGRAGVPHLPAVRTRSTSRRARA